MPRLLGRPRITWCKNKAGHTRGEIGAGHGPAYVIVTIAAAVWVGFSAFSLLRRAPFVVDPLVEYGVPESWWTPLGVAKAAGALGLLAGLFIPIIGAAAVVGLVLYFTGALVTIARARSWGHLPFPVLYLAPVIASGVLAAA